MASAVHPGFTKYLLGACWPVLISSLIVCLFPRACLTGSPSDDDPFNGYVCTSSAFSLCPDSLHFTGVINEDGYCGCKPGYRENFFGCEDEMVRPHVRLARPGASLVGEIGSNVTVSCIAAKEEDNVFSWTINGVFQAVVDTPTFTFALGSGIQLIRCEHEVRLWSSDDPLTSEPLVLTGYDSIASMSFPNTVEGIPEAAVSNTLVDLTCANIPWTREPLDCFWEVPGQPVVHGIGLYELKGVEINTETSGRSVFCYVEIGSNRNYIPSTPLPSPLETDIPQNILIVEGDRLALAGQTITFTCDFEDQPYPNTSPDITWFWLRNNVEQPGLNTSEIELTSVSQARHEGEWKCVARYLSGSAKVSPAVNLYFMEVNLTATLTASPPVPITNAAVAIRCQANVEVNVPVTYSWIHEDFPLPGYTDHTLYLLHVFTIVVRCTVKAGGQTATSDTLRLGHSVEFTDSPAPVVELVGGSSGTQLNYNDTYDVTCKVDSNWTVHCIEFEFFQDGVPVSKSGAQDYTITNDVINREYSCRAVYYHLSSPISNAVTAEFKVFKSIEIHKRRIFFWLYPELVTEINLDCGVTLHDKVPNDVIYAWYNGEGILLSDSRVLGFTVQAMVATTYRCEAWIGNHTTVSDISVMQEKLTQVIKSVDIKENRLSTMGDPAHTVSISLDCTFTFDDGIPNHNNVNYAWYDEDGVLVKSTRMLEITVNYNNYTRDTVDDSPSYTVNGTLDKTYKCRVRVGSYLRDSDYWTLVSPDEPESNQGSDDVEEIVIPVVASVAGVILVVAIVLGAKIYFSKRAAKRPNVLKSP